MIRLISKYFFSEHGIDFFSYPKIYTMYTLYTYYTTLFVSLENFNTSSRSHHICGGVVAAVGSADFSEPWRPYAIWSHFFVQQDHKLHLH